MKIVYVHFLFFFLIIVCKSQPNENTFLSVKGVYNIFEDKNKFIWIATINGLKRYDGSTLKNINFSEGVDDKFVAIISSNNAKDIICLNYYGDVFKITNDLTHIGKTLIKWLVKNDKTQRFYNSVIIKRDTLQLTYETDAGFNLVIITPHGVTKKLITHSPDLILYVNGKDIWSISAGNIIKRNGIKTDTLHTLNAKGFFVPRVLNYSKAVELYFYEDSSLKKIHLLSGELNTICKINSLTASLINDMSVDRFKNVWLFTKKGAFICDTLGQLQHFLKNENITSGFKSLNNNFYYLSNRTQGVFKVPIKKYYCSPTPSFTIKIISQGKKTAFISEDNFLYERQGNEYVKLADLNRFAVKNNKTLKIEEAKGGFLIIYDNAMVLVSSYKFLSSDAVECSKQKNLFFYSYNVNCKGVLKMSDSLYYLASRTGLIRLEMNKDTISSRTELATASSIQNIRLLNSCLYFSANKFIYVYNIKESKIIDTIKSKISISAFELLDGKIIIGSSNKGLRIISEKSETKLTTRNSNLVCDEIIKINKHQSKLWINTSEGIQSLSFHKNAPIFYQPPFLANIITDDVVFNGDSCFMLRQNGKNELIAFNVKDVVRTTKPVIYFDDLHHNGELNKTNTLVLPYLENNLSIKLGIINYENLAVKIYYKLVRNNLSSSFNLLESNYLTLNTLESGDYSLYAYSTNINRDFSEAQSTSNMLVISFVVETPFWKTIWFVLLTALLSILIIVFIVFKRLKHKAKIQNEKHDGEYKILQLEQQLFKSLMNPHFVFNSLNSIQSLVNNNRLVEASKTISTFSALVRKNLEDSLDSFCTIEDELNRLKLYVQMENLRFNNTVQFVIQQDDLVELNRLIMPAFTLQPLIENAILHGILPKGGGEITINIQKVAEEYVQIIVLDDGVGLVASLNKDTTRDKKSLALSLISKRFNNLEKIQNKHYYFDITNRLEYDSLTGTVCVIKLPIIKV